MQYKIKYKEIAENQHAVLVNDDIVSIFDEKYEALAQIKQFKMLDNEILELLFNNN